ncbi:DUF167 domain-containing protein [Micromonospora sp. SH-82]|uniref:DUF167 domain-containing protein n=1 Tax=Micromonospora sp. SH-82 TaxID=3132938 RepID=UPI003EBF9E92
MSTRPRRPPDPRRPETARGADEAFPIPVRVKPGASRTRVGGRYDGPHGPALVVAVHAPPVDGRATEAARRALAEALGLRPAVVSLRAGAASRDKLFLVERPPVGLSDVVTRLRDGVDG